ncbi:MAG: DUF2283 domain-containing protein [Archaeoglobaceae archaeon]
MVSVEFDPKVNAMYVKLRKGNVAESEPLADNVILDLDEMGRIVGIEVLLPKLDERQIRLISTLQGSKIFKLR